MHSILSQTLLTARTEILLRYTAIALTLHCLYSVALCFTHSALKSVKDIITFTEIAFGCLQCIALHCNVGSRQEDLILASSLKQTAARGGLVFSDSSQYIDPPAGLVKL